MPSDRFVRKRGDSVTVTTYSLDYSNVDEQGDPAETSTTTDTVAIFERPKSSPRQMTSAAGTELEIDSRAYIPAADVSGLGAYSADDSDRKPPRIIRQRTADEYRILATFDEGNGLVRCELELLGSSG